MSSTPGEAQNLFATPGVTTPRLAAYLLLALVLMVTDDRSAALDTVRAQIATLRAPFYWIAASPVRAARVAADAVGERRELVGENAQLKQDLLLAEARLARFAAVADENTRLRALLGVNVSRSLNGRLAEIIDVDLDPFRHRLVLDAGREQGVANGQVVIDARGVMGQIIEVEAQRATLLLVTDPAHGIPVTVLRSGVRAVAYGTGDLTRLRLPHIPFSADVQQGDQLVSSGLGGRFPPGLPIGTISAISADDSGTFAQAMAMPAASLERSGEVLVLEERQDRAEPAVEADTAAAADPSDQAATPDSAPPARAETEPAPDPSAAVPAASPRTVPSAPPQAARGTSSESDPRPQ